MPAGHALIAVVVAVLWGVNFVVVELALDAFPPLLLAVLRFTLVAVPAVAFIRRPAVDIRWLVGVGLFLCAGQFGLLFVALAEGMPAGLASLVMQLQAVFTIGLGVAVLGERPRALQTTGAAVTMAGIAVIVGGRDTDVPAVAMVLCIAAAASWALGNLCTRQAQASDPVALLVWASLVPPVPLLTLALVFEGPHALAQALAGIDAAGVAALLYVVGVSTFAGFGLWAWLLKRHAMTSLAPYTLLVPVVGIAAAWLVLGERPARADLAGAAVVLLGLLVAARAGCAKDRLRTRRLKSMGEPILDLCTATPELWSSLRSIAGKVAELGLDPGLRELLRLRASQLNECDYCVALHTRAARANGEPEERIAALEHWRDSPLFDVRDRAALALVQELTLLEGGVREAWDEAHEILDDAELAAVLWTASTMAAWNRLAIATRMDPRSLPSPQLRETAA